MAIWNLEGALAAAPATLGGSTLFTQNSDTWDDAGDAEWGSGINVLSEDKPVFILADKFYQEGSGVSYGGLDIPCRLVRTGLTITSKDRKGEWTADTSVIKEVTGIYPVIKGVAGTVVKIRIGAANEADGPIRWDTERDFVVGTDFFLDYIIAGRFLALSFRSEGQEPWELLSYDLEVNVVGQM